MTGWKLTPRETKTEMHVAGTKLFELHAGAWPGTYPLWRAMHDASPAPPEDVLERMARAMWRRDSTNYTASGPIPHVYFDMLRSALSAAQHSTQGEG